MTKGVALIHLDLIHTGCHFHKKKSFRHVLIYSTMYLFLSIAESFVNIADNSHERQRGLAQEPSIILSRKKIV